MSRISRPLPTETVCSLLANAGADEVTVGKVFAARLKPENLDDPDRKFVIGVPVPRDRAMLVVYRFGKAIGAEEDHWKPVWLSVEGPFALDEVNEKAKALTGG